MGHVAHLGRDTPPANVLITGASGFIGRRLAAAVLREGATVRCLVRNPNAAAIPQLEGCELVFGDLRDPGAIASAVRGASVVFHLAALVGDWLPPKEALEVNVEGTARILNAACTEGARSILASSVAVYGKHLTSHVCFESASTATPVGIYGETKAAQENAAALSSACGGDVVVLRLANTFGPHSRLWVDAPVEYLRSGLPGLVGDGAGDAQLLHVDNAVNGFLAAWRSPSARGAYNIADGHGVSWARYLSDLANVAGTRPPRSMPRFAAHALARASEVAWRIGRQKRRPPLTREALQLLESRFPIPIGKAQDELGYSASVSYEAGIASVDEYLATLR